MINDIAESLTNRLIRTQVVQKEDYEIYNYGIKQLLSKVIGFCLVIAYGVLMKSIYECILYVAFFGFIRKYAGGYHASSRVRCFFVTSVVVLSSLSAMKYGEFDNSLQFGILAISAIIIIILSPVGTKNKELDEIEKIMYRKKSMIALGLEIVVAILCACFGLKQELLCIIFAQLTMAFTLIIGKMLE